MKILIADDHIDAAECMAALLRQDGHHVAIAHGGLEAVSLGTIVYPDVMLVDIDMPDLTGYDVARAVRARPWGADVLLVAVTGNGERHDRDAAVSAGFDTHRRKPLEAEDLLALVHRARSDVRA